MGKEIIQIQIALFFQSDFVGSFEEFSLKLKTKLGESKITQHIPVPIDAPSEIPRLILPFEKFNINVSKNRLDLFSKDISLVEDVISNISNVLLSELSIIIGRIGFVKQSFIDSDTNDLKKLLSKKIAKLNFREINIRVDKRESIGGQECNNIENLSSGYVIKKELSGKETKREGIIIVRDVNTLVEELSRKKFTKEEINALIKVFDEKSNSFILWGK